MRATGEMSGPLTPTGTISGFSPWLRRRLSQIPDKYRAYLLTPPALLAFLCLWQLLVTVGSYPTFILPAPAIVFRKFVAVLADGTLLHHTWATVREVLLGLALGLSVATCLGYVFAKSKPLERLLSPYIVASQSMPIVALAPLLVIWFGFGTLSKVIVCALTVFFPVLVNTIVGLRSVDENLVDLMRSYQATRRQMFAMLEIPAALPVLLGGLKIGVTLSVIGAVVGEFVAADEGLGFLVNLSRGLFDTPMMFVALFVLAIIALSLYGCVVLLENRLLSWQRIK
jgi:NitT/TauT family transport system permease protein